MNYKITIEYDGTRYKGFQKQTGTKENDSTIQGKIEAVIMSFVSEGVQLIGCGRTDAGVHSQNYIANFITSKNIDEEKLLKHFDMYLPEDIFVKEVSLVSDRFHSRYNAKSKIYQYRFATDRKRTVFNRKYSYLVDGEIDINKMKSAASLLIGKKDFSGFSNLKSKKKSTIREIYKIEIYRESNGEVLIEIEGNGFLQNMVRIISGTLLEIGQGKRDSETIAKAFESGNREDTGVMVPAQGLKLLQVKY